MCTTEKEQQILNESYKKIIIKKRHTRTNKTIDNKKKRNHNFKTSRPMNTTNNNMKGILILDEVADESDPDNDPSPS